MILMPAACYRYFIDGLGARVRKVTPSAETWFVYDEAGHLLGEYDSAGNAVQETVYLGDTPVAVLKGTEVFYVYADHLHAPRLIADNSNKAVWQWNSDPFGVTLANADPDGDGVAFSYNLRFPGQYFDGETRLHYNYFRDYNPSTGRYIESDPIGLDGGLNTFGYVGGNPVNWVDPLGLFSVNQAVDIACGGCHNTSLPLPPTSSNQASSMGGLASKPAPYTHPEEHTARNVIPDPFGSNCEEMRKAIQVYEAQIAWRYTDLNRASPEYASHLRHIKMLEGELAKLKAAYENICGKCNK